MNRGDIVEQVTKLKQDEFIRLDPVRLEELYVQLGENEAESVVYHALEEVAARLSFAQRCYREGRAGDMRKSMGSLAAIAQQIGMMQLARVADDVARCIDDGDKVALSATQARLQRIGERSLCEIWGLPGLSI